MAILREAEARLKKAEQQKKEEMNKQAIAERRALEAELMAK
jgi:hypothetical protein